MRHGQIVAVVADVAGQPVGDEAADVVAHVHAPRASASRKATTAPIACRSAAAARVVVRVGQAAHVEDQVGVERDAVLEAEGLEQQRQPCARLEGDEILDPGAQGVGPEVAGVDAVAEGGNRFERIALAADRLGQRARRSPADGAGASRKSAGSGIRRWRAGTRRYSVCRLPRAGAAFPAVPRCRARSGRRWRPPTLVTPSSLSMRTRKVSMTTRQVVHAVIARIFEQVQGDGFAGPGESANDNEFHYAEHNEGDAEQATAA